MWLSCLGNTAATSRYVIIIPFFICVGTSHVQFSVTSWSGSDRTDAPLRKDLPSFGRLNFKQQFDYCRALGYLLRDAARIIEAVNWF